MRQKLSILAILLVACSGGERERRGGSDPGVEAAFQRDAEAFYSAYFEARPGRGVTLGLHQYDGRLPDVSPAALAAEGERLRAARERFEAVPAAALSPQGRVEREVLLREIRAELFELADRKRPERDPIMYMGALDVNYYISRDYAPLEQRARAVIAICRGAGPYLAQARANVSEVVPRPWLDIALLATNGAIEFLHDDVRAAFAGLSDPALARELDAALATCAAELTTHRDHLVAQLAAANDDFALGPERFSRMLSDTEGIDIDLPTLQRIAEADLARNLAAMNEAARAIDPKRSTAEVVAEVMADKPAPDALLAEAGRQATDMRAFLIDHHIVTIPSEDTAEVRESPPYERWNGASLNEAGPFEPRPLPAFYYISPPDPKWSPEEQSAYIPARTALLFTTVHELWPGHFLQGLHQRRNPSRILKSFYSYAMSEGWAHYTEQLMWDEGVGAGDPRVHVGQLTEALLRDVRFVSALGLHTGGMTVDQSAALFEEKAFADKATARQQAVRGTFDPMYLNYTVGKLMIMKLREDWRAKVGPAYSLQAFHDQFLSYGCAPVPVIRRAMLGDDAGPAL